MISTQNTTQQTHPLAALFGGAAAGGASQTQEAQDRFLTLLVTQMKNQDPLNPMDNAQLTSQLAQISTVNGVQQLNTTLNSLRGDIGGLSALDAVALAGRQVLVNGNVLPLAAGHAAGGFELAQPADQVTLTVLDANGVAVHRAELGAQAAGIHSFDWDGVTDAGAVAAEGIYTVTLQASAQGQAAAVTALSLARVDGVMRGADGINLNLGTLGTRSLADVRQVN
ncbi:MAG: flagellar hook assembly protein FlgD [Betaproteobacteria bacterium]|nr:flagellar hook assembly protein FlgD [Betaproteobacteria bacterium]